MSFSYYYHTNPPIESDVHTLTFAGITSTNLADDLWEYLKTNTFGETVRRD